MTLRKKKKAAALCSLFPFLDCLSGIIGVLALIISVLAVSGLSASKQVFEYSGSEQKFTPMHVECGESSIVLHPERKELLLDVPSDVDRWERYLTNVSRRKATHYIVFMIRPSGIETFEAARYDAESMGIKVGWTAVQSTGEIEVATRD